MLIALWIAGMIVAWLGVCWMLAHICALNGDGMDEIDAIVDLTRPVKVHVANSKSVCDLCGRRLPESFVVGALVIVIGAGAYQVVKPLDRGVEFCR